MKKEPKALTVSCVQHHWAQDIDFNLKRAVHYLKEAKKEGSRVVLFPEANITSYYFPYAMKIAPAKIQKALDTICSTAKELDIYTIVGSIRKTPNKYINVAHVVNNKGKIIHEYAKVQMAGIHEAKYCRGGNKLSFFEIDGILCTMVICRDGRHPELYRIPAMAGAKIVFQPSCSTNSIEEVTWKRSAGRAQYPKGPNSKIFHLVANTIGQSPDGQQSTSGSSFIREPSGLPLAEAGYYHEEMITGVLDLSTANRKYVLESLGSPPFLKKYWKGMIQEMKKRKDIKPV